jgi:hypothetical protein
VALRGDVADRDGALAVGLLPEGAAILPLDADGVLALLREGGVVDHEDPRRVGELRRHLGPIAPEHGELVPGALAEELLQRLVGVGDVEPGRQGDAGGHRLDALAVAVGEQAPQIGAAPGGLPRAVEVVAERGRVVGEPSEDVGGEFGGLEQFP